MSASNYRNRCILTDFPQNVQILFMLCIVLRKQTDINCIAFVFAVALRQRDRRFLDSACALSVLIRDLIFEVHACHKFFCIHSDPHFQTAVLHPVWFSQTTARYVFCMLQASLCGKHAV